MIIGVYGKPRSGKSTFLARKVFWARIKKTFCGSSRFLRAIFAPYDAIFCLDPSFKGCICIDRFDVGAFDPTVYGRTLFILNEAGSNYNNKDFKNLPPHVRAFWAQHGHYHCDIIWDSQTVNVNNELRNKTDHYYVIRRKRGKSVVNRISYDIGCNATNDDLVEKFSEPRGFFSKLIARLLHLRYSFRRSHYYKEFDSHVKQLEFHKSAPARVDDHKSPWLGVWLLVKKFFRSVVTLIVICYIIEYLSGM